MVDEGFKRKLTAILSADVEGYSRLMDDDEEATVRTLKSYRNAITDLTRQYRGRVVDSPGDNILTEFSSVVDAVNCAVEIQRKLAERNTALPYKRQMQFRIGVNLGDVIEEDGRIYGDGVNIAARIESLAEAGGICISRNVYDQVRDKLSLKSEYLGEHIVKNIKEPIRIYKIIAETDECETPELPDVPSIAVLPFVNMSRDPSQEFFSDGLTEQITNGLSRISNLFVIARNSAFSFKGKSVKAQTIGKELGVKYILEGSVQRSRKRVRIVAQLIDTKTGYHAWSEHFDRKIGDIFALQDEITTKLITAMHVKLNLNHGESYQQYGKFITTDVGAYDKILRGVELVWRYTKKDNLQSRQFFEESIKLDKSSVLGHFLLGFTHFHDFIHGWSDSPIESFEQTEKCIKKSIALNEFAPFSHALLSFIYAFKRQHQKAIEVGERAIALNPNGALEHAFLGHVYIWSDEPEHAVRLIKKAIRLDPVTQPFMWDFLASAYRDMGLYEKAIEMCKNALKDAPNWTNIFLCLAVCYAKMERHEEAKFAVKEVLRTDPDFSLDFYENVYPFINQSKRKSQIEVLRKLGLK